MTLIKNLNLNGNPFEHYTAETEPDIAEYAVRPPYLQAISARAHGLSSFILFGERGAGKSATRLTVYKEIWDKIGRDPAKAKGLPFAVNLTDFSPLLEPLKKDRLTEREIVAIVAFAVVEQMLVWLSEISDPLRSQLINKMERADRALVYALIDGFYLSVPEMDREISTTDTLKLLNSAWTKKGSVWAAKHWDALSQVIAAAISAISKKSLDTEDISGPAEQLLKSLKGESVNAPRAILSKLVDFSRVFGFQGITVLADKLDETAATSNSAEATARLIHPLLAHIQLLEIEGFSWLMFLWNNLRSHFNGDKYPVRLDKIAHADITWSEENLQQMLENRVGFFSGRKLSLKDLFASDLEIPVVAGQIISISQKSPRELIKLMDTVFREHDARGKAAPLAIDTTSLDAGQDKYSTQTIGEWYPKELLQQVLRVGKTSFINKDVQQIFKIGDQGARVKIKTWEDSGLVSKDGTAANDSGAKQAYRYVVADPRIARIIERRLDEVVGVAIVGGEENE